MSAASRKRLLVVDVTGDISDDDQFYSNYVGRRCQQDMSSDLLVEPIVLNNSAISEIEHDPDLDSDLSDIEEEQASFKDQLAQKARKQQEAQEKKLMSEIDTISSSCKLVDTGFEVDPSNVHSLAAFEKVKEDIAYMDHLQKSIVSNKVVGHAYGDRTSDTVTPPMKLAKKGLVILKINDLDNYRFSRTNLSWPVDSTFGELRHELAKKRNSHAKTTSLTIDNFELEDDKTPADLKLSRDKVHTVDVMSVDSNDDKVLPTFKCIQKDDRPILIQVDLTETFFNIANLLREKGAKFTKIMFDHEEVDYNSTPADLDMEHEDILDLL